MCKKLFLIVSLFCVGGMQAGKGKEAVWSDSDSSTDEESDYEDTLSDEETDYEDTNKSETLPVEETKVLKGSAACIKATEKIQATDEDSKLFKLLIEEAIGKRKREEGYAVSIEEILLPDHDDNIVSKLKKRRKDS